MPAFIFLSAGCRSCCWRRRNRHHHQLLNRFSNSMPRRKRPNMMSVTWECSHSTSSSETRTAHWSGSCEHPWKRRTRSLQACPSRYCYSWSSCQCACTCKSCFEMRWRKHHLAFWCRRRCSGCVFELRCSVWFLCCRATLPAVHERCRKIDAGAKFSENATSRWRGGKIWQLSLLLQMREQFGNL